MKFEQVKILCLFAILFVYLTGCPTPNVTSPTNFNGSLIISEVGSCPYTNVSSWFEVYNNTSFPAQLAYFKLRTYARMKADPYTFSGVITFNLPSLVISPGSYALIMGKISNDYVNGSRIVYIDNSSNLVPNWVYDGTAVGNGFIELLKDNTSIDFVRFGSNTDSPVTGSAWSGAFNAPVLPTGSSSNYGTSIARDSLLTDTNTSSDWSFCDFATAGGPNDLVSDTDNDSDGIPDECEVTESTFAGLPLYDWGARTNQKDIFIHIDYMDSSDPACTPRREALDKVRDVFLTKNIHVHFDTGTLFGSSPDDYNLDGTNHKVPFSSSISLGFQDGKANLYDYKYKYMNLAKKQIFHYLLMAYSQNADASASSSGIAEVKGNDIIITMGNWGLNTSNTANTNTLINYQASTIMHEFGHNLGLYHGGSEIINYMPNYISIMNYMYQLSGLPTIGTNEGDRYYYYRKYIVNDSAFSSFLFNGANDLTNNHYQSSFIMDYSNGTGGTIDENDIIENLGLKRSGTNGVDFNGDGDILDTSTMDLNNDSAMNVFSDYDDWLNLFFFFQRTWSGYNSGAFSQNILRIIPDPIGNDFQEVIIETLKPEI